MKIREPKFWWIKNSHLFFKLIILNWNKFLSLFIFLKIFLTKKYSPIIPVICIGNFVVGGQGKTPFVRLLRQILESKGVKSGVILTGYGGFNKTTKIINKNDSPSEFGDESILHAADGLTIVSKNRKKSFEALENIPIDIAILDDGLQDASIKKDINIALIDLSKGSGNGSLIPFGPLRETLTQGIQKTDLIIFINSINKEHSSIEEIKKIWKGPSFFAEYKTILDEKIKSDVVLYSGISNPRKFSEGVKNNKRRIKKSFIFADHQRIDEKKAKNIIETSHLEGADIVTTEKDYFRLRDSPRGSQREKLFLLSKVAKLKIIIDEQSFLKFLTKKLNIKFN
jgi:tetraacyldisaccharide 4'-kinase